MNMNISPKKALMAQVKGTIMKYTPLLLLTLFSASLLAMDHGGDARDFEIDEERAAHIMNQVIGDIVKLRAQEDEESVENPDSNSGPANGATTRDFQNITQNLKRNRSLTLDLVKSFLTKHSRDDEADRAFCKSVNFEVVREAERVLQDTCPCLKEIEHACAALFLLKSLATEFNAAYAGQQGFLAWKILSRHNDFLVACIGRAETSSDKCTLEDAIRVCSLFETLNIFRKDDSKSGLKIDFEKQLAELDGTGTKKE